MLGAPQRDGGGIRGGNARQRLDEGEHLRVEPRVALEDRRRPDHLWAHRVLAIVATLLAVVLRTIVLRAIPLRTVVLALALLARPGVLVATGLAGLLRSLALAALVLPVLRVPVLTIPVLGVFAVLGIFAVLILAGPTTFPAFAALRSGLPRGARGVRAVRALSPLGRRGARGRRRGGGLGLGGGRAAGGSLAGRRSDGSAGLLGPDHVDQITLAHLAGARVVVSVTKDPFLAMAAPNGGMQPGCRCGPITFDEAAEEFSAGCCPLVFSP